MLAMGRSYSPGLSMSVRGGTWRQAAVMSCRQSNTTQAPADSRQQTISPQRPRSTSLPRSHYALTSTSHLVLTSPHLSLSSPPAQPEFKPKVLAARPGPARPTATAPGARGTSPPRHKLSVTRQLLHFKGWRTVVVAVEPWRLGPHGQSSSTTNHNRVPARQICTSC